MGRSPLAATHLSGFFSLSLMQMVGMATPLWADRLPMRAVMIGLASGARSIMPLIYSIHFGRMMNVFGVRRFIVFFAAQCAILPVLYPLIPYGAAFLVLQLLLGLAAATVWLAAQTAIARSVGGDPQRLGCSPSSPRSERSSARLRWDLSGILSDRRAATAHWHSGAPACSPRAG